MHVNFVKLRAIRQPMAYSWFFMEPGMWRELATPGRMVAETDIKWHKKRLQ